MLSDTEGRLKVLLYKIVRREVNTEDNIFVTGFVSSLIFKQLIFSIEQEFAIKIKVTDIRLENFGTIASIAELIKLYLAPS